MWEKIEEGIKSKAVSSGPKKLVGSMAMKMKMLMLMVMIMMVMVMMNVVVTLDDGEHQVKGVINENQVMDWAKRQALAHHAAEEKGLSKQDSPNPCPCQQACACGYSGKLMDVVLVLVNNLVYIIVVLVPGVAHTSLGYTLASKLIFSKLHKVINITVEDGDICCTVTFPIDLNPEYFYPPLLQIQALGMEGGKGKGYAIGFFFII